MKLYIRILAFIVILLLLWWLYNYLTKQNYNLSPIDRCSLRYDRERVYEFDDLLTKDECNMIINMANPKVSKSAVLSKEKYHPGRTSSHVFLSSNHPLLQKIDNIVYSYLGIPIENYENLQVVNYKSTDARDRSHFEQFKSYIESAYRFVEPSSVTPYALPSRLRSLHAAIIIALRHSGYGLSKNEHAYKLDLNNQDQMDAIELLKKRMQEADINEDESIEKHFDEILRQWEGRVVSAEEAGRKLRYKHATGQSGLIKPFGEYHNNPDIMETLGSMRSVDSETEISNY